MKIFTPINEDTGVGYYRIVEPTKELAHQESAYIMSTPFSGNFVFNEIDAESLDKGSRWCDVIFMNVARSMYSLAVIMALRDNVKKKLIIDIDDNAININPDHPVYDAFMNEDLKPSLYIQKSIQYADMVTVTTPYLADFYKGLNNNIYVNPNAIDFKIWDKLKKPKFKKLRIGWAGAAGHWDNLKYIEEPLRQIRKKYDIEFIAFGELPAGFDADKTYKFVNFNKYDKTYAKLGFDIVIAPLLDTRYNRGKSNLRLIESGALKIPAIASPVGPYKDFPCLYADDKLEWYEQLERLIKDESLRKDMGEKAYNEVKTKYNIETTAPKLLKAFDKVLEEPWKVKTKLSSEEQRHLKKQMI